MANFTGQLNSNLIYSALHNMIISQQVFADNIKGTYSSLVDEARTDGTLYGDTKLYYAVDVLKSSAWGNDAEAQNLLALHRPAAPAVQAITMDVYRQVAITVDNYLSKQAWTDEAAFSQFTGVIRGSVNDTKKVYDSTTYNAYLGTAHGAATKSTVEVPLSDITATGEEKNRLEAQMIAQYIADLISEMEDVSRDFNDYGYLRSYDRADIKIIWNVKFLNKITKLDLPTVFHKDILSFENKLPARYFGDVNTGAKVADAKTRSLVEQEIAGRHYFAGDPIKVGDTAPAGKSYQVDEDVIAKVVVKLPPFLSAFSVNTNFYNAKSLTENSYLTWGHNTLEYLKNYPFITVHAD